MTLAQSVYDNHILVALNKTSKLRGHNVYLCKYSGDQCQSGDLISLKNGRCIKESMNTTSWHEARRGCLKTGGDLAILNRQEIQTLSSINTSQPSNGLQSHRFFGFESISWGWNKGEDDVEYGTWSESEAPGTMNLCVAYAPSGWIAQNCSSRNYVVCQKEKTNGSENDLTTLSFGSSSKSTESVKSETAFDSRTQASEFMKTYGFENELTTISSESSNAILLIIGAALAIILCVFVVVIIAIRRKKKAATKPDWMAVENINPSPQFPAQFRDNIRGVYAEIPAIAQLDDSQEGVAYAALQFLKKDETGIPHMVGPMGDVYAIPMSKQKLETGAMEEIRKIQPPTIVGPQGDVYTLPFNCSIT